MPATIMLLLTVVHLAYALLSRSLTTDESLFIVSLMEGVGYSSLAMLAAIAAIGPGPAVCRLPTVILLTLAWFCARGFGDCLAGGQVNHNHMISDAFQALIVFPAAALGILLVNLRPRWRLVWGPMTFPPSRSANRFSLTQLLAFVTAAGIGCILLRWALTPYHWQLGSEDNSFVWADWLGNRLAEHADWLISDLGACLASLIWATPALGRIRFFRAMLFVLAGGALMASTLCLIEMFWTHISVWPATPSGFRIHYVQGWGIYVGVSLGILFSAIHLRAAGFRLAGTLFGQSLSDGPVEPTGHRRRTGRKMSVAVLAAIILLLAGFAAFSVSTWRAKYDQERRQKIEWQEKFEQQ